MSYNYQPQTLAGKSILITGGTTGIGRSAAQRFVADGANVLIFGRHEQELQDALRDIEVSGNGSIFGLTADSGKPEDVKRAFAEADARLGGVDILINNAAVSAGSIVDTEEEEWHQVIHTNLLGYLSCARHAIDRMKIKGEGHIVNIGSMSAKETTKGSDIYVTTKSALEGFSESLGKQVAEQGIKVTLIEPGLVGTDMTTAKVPVEKQPQKEEEGSMLKAEDIAECIHYVVTQPRRCDIGFIRIYPHKGEEK